MIYGICAITFNVVMSYDCMPYMSQVLVDRTPYGTPLAMSWYRPPIYFRLFSYF